MTPDMYLGSTSSATYCFLQLVEETSSNIKFWLMGDNFLRGYYQTYDMTGKRVGLASSKFITNNSYSFNNSVIYIPPSQPITSTTGTVINSTSEKILGFDQMDFTIILIVVCGGGSFLLISIGVCIYCYIRIRNRKRAERSSN